VGGAEVFPRYYLCWSPSGGKFSADYIIADRILNEGALRLTEALSQA
jgi:hypothetical protein